MTGRDWLAMTPQDFDVDAEPAGLFELPADALVVDDGHGTGDLLDELPTEES